jgi:hypothetical protein
LPGLKDMVIREQNGEGYGEWRYKTSLLPQSRTLLS